jgi:hypothetical protein
MIIKTDDLKGAAPKVRTITREEWGKLNDDQRESLMYFIDRFIEINQEKKRL